MACHALKQGLSLSLDSRIISPLKGDHRMTQQILFIHGAGGYESDSKLADSLRQALGADYHIANPRMPNEDEPESDAWKTKILEELAALDGPVILVGHSLGASTLLKVLSEEQLKTPIAGVFLVATPYWKMDEYKLRDDFASRLPAGVPLFLYHGKNDTDVPFNHLAMYAAKLPQATIHEVEGRDHQFNDDLSIVAADIKRL
jgi:uncharacterized protein